MRAVGFDGHSVARGDQQPRGRAADDRDRRVCDGGPRGAVLVQQHAVRRSEGGSRRLGAGGGGDEGLSGLCMVTRVT